jgi:hypothetical protein
LISAFFCAVFVTGLLGANCRHTYYPFFPGISIPTYTKEELKTICGLGDPLGLCGINCYHSYDPFVPGVSVRRYSDEDLERLRREDAEEHEWNGKNYNKYEALQEQRHMERQMRKYRRDAELLEQGGADDELIENKRIKYQTKFSQYKAFSKTMGLPMQRDRIYNDGLSLKTVAKSAKSSIIISKESGPIPMNLQLFGEEQALGGQNEKNLKKGIKSLENKIVRHEYKIQHPAEFYDDWDQVPDVVQQGRLDHWKKEMETFKIGISNRKAELKRREKNEG